MLQGVRAAAKSTALGLAAWTLMAVAPMAAQTQADGDAILPAAVNPDAPSVTLAGVIMEAPVGQVWFTLGSGFFCGLVKRNMFGGGRIAMKQDVLRDSFRQVMEGAGYKVPGDTSNLFEASSAARSTDIAIAALIEQNQGQVCSDATSPAMVKGDWTMRVQWQVYSRIRHQMLAKVETSGDYHPAKPISGGSIAMFNQAFLLNLQQLVDAPEFRKAVSTAPDATDDVIRPASQARIVLASGAPIAGVPISDVAGSVVLIQAGASVGSGVLISSDGYVLTDAHVVGDAKEVKVRWSDGLEKLGQVVRVAKGRDVALIKTDGRGRTPLPLRSAPPVVGEGVFAVGAPLGQQFQGTVTRGVVSAERIMDGYGFIQSDVSVTHGSSGGPLLDEKGRLIGLTVSGRMIAGLIPTGINLFIPARDAADFLNLDIR